MSKNKETAFFLMVALVCILLVIFVFPNQIPQTPVQDNNFSSWVAPLVGIVIIFITSLLESVFTYKRDKEKSNESKNTSKTRKLLISILFIVIYTFVGISTIGFYLSTIIFLLVIMFFLGERRWWLLLIVSLGIIMFIHLLFSYYLGINFPKGFFFS